MFDTGLRQLDEAIDRLVEEDATLADDTELGANLVALRARVDRLDAEWQRRFGVFERRAGWKEQARTAAAWLRRVCRMAGGQARMRVQAVRRLPRLDAVRAAYEAGEISFGHVAMIVRSVTELREEHVDAADGVFADAAKDLAPADLEKVVALWRETVDPEASVKDFKDAQERRRGKVARVGDMLYVRAWLDPVGGEPFATAISAFMEADRRKDDPRRYEQRCADAFTGLAEAALRAGETPTAGGERPRVDAPAHAGAAGGRATGGPGVGWADPR